MRQKSGTKKAACRSGDSLDHAFSHRPWHVNRPDYAQMARVDPGYDRHRMLCISCPIGFFHTVADASAADTLDEAIFTAELLAAMRTDPSAETPSQTKVPEPGKHEGEVSCA